MDNSSARETEKKMVRQKTQTQTREKWIPRDFPRSGHADSEANFVFITTLSNVFACLNVVNTKIGTATINPPEANSLRHLPSRSRAQEWLFVAWSHESL